MTSAGAPLGVADEARARLDQLVGDGVLPDADDTVAVLVIGSRARGWANPTSDHDFLVVLRREIEIQEAKRVAVALIPPTVQVREVVTPTGQYEFAYWTEGQISQLLDQVSRARFDAGSLSALGDAEEDVMERLVTAVPVMGAAWLDDPRARLGGTGFRAYLTTRSLSLAEDRIEDVKGMLAVHDVESAVLAARLALDHTVDALLDSHGNHGSRVPKWRMRRLHELDSPAITPERYWEFMTMADYAAVGPGAWIAAVVRECQALSVQIEI